MKDDLWVPSKTGCFPTFGKAQRVLTYDVSYGKESRILETLPRLQEEVL